MPQPRDSSTGGPDTVPMDKDRKAFLEQMRRQNQQARDEAARGVRSPRARPPANNAKGGKIMAKSDKAGRALVKKSADTKGRAMMNKGGSCYAGGGSVSSRADGIAKKGRTHTKMPAMAKGGKMKKGKC